REDIQHRSKLFPIHVPVGADMAFVLPGSDACQLGRYRHGAAVVGAVEQKSLEHLRIAGDKTRAQSRQVGAFGQAVENHAALEIVATQGSAGSQEPGWWLIFIKVEFAVAFVG